MCSTAAFADPIAPVNRVIRFSCVDGPGNRTVVFLQGCCFTCKYCHNPETINMCVDCGKCVTACPAGALSMADGKVAYDHAKCCMCDTCIKTCPNMASPRVRNLRASEVMALIRANMPFIRGVTVSGGECTLHRDFCLALARLCREAGLNFLLDCNGSWDFESDPELTEAIDGVMLDVKAFNNADHLALTGADNAVVIKNLKYLARVGRLEEVRTVVLPDLTDPEDTVRNVCLPLRDIAPDTRYKLISYRPMGVREPFKSALISPDDARMSALADLAHSLGINNTVIL